MSAAASYFFLPSRRALRYRAAIDLAWRVLFTARRPARGVWLTASDRRG